MGRLIRLFIFTLLAFVMGIFYEKKATGDRCEMAGGVQESDGVCIKASANG